MYRLVFGNQFLKSAEKLDKKLKPKLKLSLDVLLRDPFHPKLHTKPLAGNLAGRYSFRLGRDYRVVFAFLSKDEIQVFNIAHRKDIYR